MHNEASWPEVYRFRLLAAFPRFQSHFTSLAMLLNDEIFDENQPNSGEQKHEAPNQNPTNTSNVVIAACARNNATTTRATAILTGGTHDIAFWR